MITADLSGIDRLATYIDEFPARAGQAITYALNRVLPRGAIDLYIKDMLAENAFPAGYLETRITFTKPATTSDLTAIVTGRDRPTSLSRFAQGANGDVTVTVNPGNTKPIKGAFFVNLPRGGDSQDGTNLGLAIRLKPGTTLRNKKDPGGLVYLAKNVVLLYGPSVGQILDDVAVEDEDQVVDDIMQEFDRQFVRLI